MIAIDKVTMVNEQYNHYEIEFDINNKQHFKKYFDMVINL